MEAKLDWNYVPVLLWEDSTDPTNTLPILIDPITGAILCENA
jgi:hypothetical protein